jgi:hypothetical protein
MTFVRVFLPTGASMRSRSLEGQVVRQTPDGFAIEWCELAPEVVRSLAQMETSRTARLERDVPRVAKSASAQR